MHFNIPASEKPAFQAAIDRVQTILLARSDDSNNNLLLSSITLTAVELAASLQQLEAQLEAEKTQSHQQMTDLIELVDKVRKTLQLD